MGRGAASVEEVAIARREAPTLPLADLLERRGDVPPAAERALKAAAEQLLLPQWLGGIELRAGTGNEIRTISHISHDGVRSVRVPAAIEVGPDAREKALGTLRQLGQILEEALVSNPTSRRAYNDLVDEARKTEPMRTLAAIKDDHLRAQEEYERVFDRLVCQLVCSRSSDTALRAHFNDVRDQQLLWWEDDEFAPLEARLRELLAAQHLAAAA